MLNIGPAFIPSVVERLPIYLAWKNRIDYMSCSIEAFLALRCSLAVQKRFLNKTVDGELISISTDERCTT